MFNSAHFSRMPSSKKAHTKFKMPSVISGTSNHGELIPIDCYFALPGDIDHTRLNGEIRMSTPIAPIMSQIKGSINVFFVPWRLVWDHSKEFFGENSQTAGPQQNNYKIPQGYFNASDDNDVVVGSVSHYLGKPLKKDIDAGDGLHASCLKERAFWLIYSEYYRAEQVMNPVLIDKSDDGTKIGSKDGVDLYFGTKVPHVLKDFDYFTTMTRSPEYGPAVELPLGSVAPVFLDPKYAAGQVGDTTRQKILFKDDIMYELSGQNFLNGSNGNLIAQGFNTGDEDQMIDNVGSNGSAYLDPNGTMLADLSKATAATIDELYLAMAAQAWYHNANYGSRYFEMLEVHYGVSNPDLVMIRPEHIAEFKFDINVQQVLATAATEEGQIGQPGANSLTYIRKNLYNKSFGEHGFVMVLFSTYHQRYYSAGIMREDFYEELFDIYFPEFANIGDQAVLRKELFADESDGDFISGVNSDVIGYQEAWAELRFRPSRATGLLDPYAKSGVNSDQNALSYWILADKFESSPTLNEEFLLEDRNAISKALVSGENGPDYVWSFYFDRTMMREIPAFSVPGLPGRGRGII